MLSLIFEQANATGEFMRKGTTAGPLTRALGADQELAHTGAAEL
jgi:hypothetical protein